MSTVSVLSLIITSGTALPADSARAGLVERAFTATTVRCRSLPWSNATGDSACTVSAQSVAHNIFESWEGAQRWEEVYQTEKALVLLWPVIPGAQGSMALSPADMLGWFEVPSCQNSLASLSAKWPSITHQSVSSKFVNISIQRYTLYLLSSSLNVIMVFSSHNDSMILWDYFEAKAGCQ